MYIEKIKNSGVMILKELKDIKETLKESLGNQISQINDGVKERIN